MLCLVAREGPDAYIVLSMASHVPRPTPAAVEPIPGLGPIQQWLGERNWDEGVTLMIAGAALGALAGLSVIGFYGLIDLSHYVFIELPGSRLGRVAHALYWPVLTAFGMWAAWFVVKRTNTPDGQNVPDVQLAVAKHGAVMRGRPVAVRTLASAITLGSGGSAGSEGPVAVLGAAVGSVLGRRLRIQPRHRKILVGCGAGAGIAAAFNAPFAGAFFALEEVLGSFSVGAFSPVVIASVVGAMTAQSVLGVHPAFHLPEVGNAHPLTSVLLYPLLGVACGLVSILYVKLYLTMGKYMERIPGPEWVRPLVGGALVGGIVAASGGILAGNGHLAIPSSVFGGLAWYALLGITLAKIVATALTFASGGSGGVFTPTLFIGAALGGGVGVFAQTYIPGDAVHASAWALVGMAGLVAGATRAPLTAIFIVYEMTNRPGYVIPLMVVAVVSFVTSKKYAPYGLYDGWLAARGVHLSHGIDEAVMERVLVVDAFDREAVSVNADAPIAQLVSAAAATQDTVLPVIDENRTVIGIVTHHAIREAILAREALDNVLVAADIAEPVEPLTPGQSLGEALAAMNARGVDALPVVDGTAESSPLLGLLSRGDVLEAYERELALAV